MSENIHHNYPPIKEAFKQPRSVWAIAFATTISFMGIGLVDPILPAIAKELDATPTQAMLLFTSYLVITAITMFFTAWVSSRLGLRKTIMIGLTLVIIFATACSLSGSVNQIIGWRSGWGLGNALFISTALSAIVSAAHGGVAGAIILYEAAIGLGMAVGPLAGGLLGSFSWRGPFLGTAILMAIGFLAIVMLYQRERKPKTRNLGIDNKTLSLPDSNGHIEKVALETIETKNEKSGETLALAAAADNQAATADDRNTAKSVGKQSDLPSLFVAFQALKNPALGVLSFSALFYNMVFFVLLAYSPFPIEAIAQSMGIKFGEMQLGLVFFGWGIGLALTSVGLAPVLTRRIGLLPTIKWGLALSAALMGVMALGSHSLVILVVTVVFSGLIFGILNTAFTEAVMDATTLARNVASSAYSGVRFLGGAIASAGAGTVAALGGVGAPYWVGFSCSIFALGLLIFGDKYLDILRKPLHLSGESEAQAIAYGG